MRNEDEEPAERMLEGPESDLFGQEESTLLVTASFAIAQETLRFPSTGSLFWSRAEITAAVEHCFFVLHSVHGKDFSFGYVVETFYDQPSAEVFLLAGPKSRAEDMTPSHHHASRVERVRRCRIPLSDESCESLVGRTMGLTGDLWSGFWVVSSKQNDTLRSVAPKVDQADIDSRGNHGSIYDDQHGPWFLCFGMYQSGF